MRSRALCLLGLVFGLSPSAFAQNLFQKIPPSIQHGIEAYQKERFEEANDAFEKAQTEMPSNAQLEFNRGTTFYKQEKFNEALQSLDRAREWDDGKLRGDIFYNMGNTYAAMGKAAEAMASYRQALRINPQDTMARHNLEFLLRQPPPQNAPKNNDTSKEEDKPDDSDAKSDTDSASSQQQPRDEPTTPTSSDNETKDTPEKQEDTSQTPNHAKPDSASQQNNSREETLDKNAQEDVASGKQERRLSKEEADKILDAFGVDEKSYEPWRFQQKPPVEEWQYEQDW